MSFKKLKKSLKYRASNLSNATVLNVPDLNKTKSKWRDIRSPTVAEARCKSAQNAVSAHRGEGIITVKSAGVRSAEQGIWKGTI